MVDVLDCWNRLSGSGVLLATATGVNESGRVIAFGRHTETTAQSFLFLLVSMIFVGLLLRWEDVLVVFFVVAAVQGLMRKSLAVLSVLLFAAAYPPWNLLTWVFCFTPLIVLWQGTNDRRPTRDLFEGVVIGFAMCWLTTGFVRDAVATRGWLLQGSGCLLFGMQMVLIPITLRWLGNRSVLFTAGVLSVVWGLGEWMQAFSMDGIVWAATAFYLSVGNTPLAQWASLISPMGISVFLFAINFLWLPERSTNGLKRWRGPVLASTLVSLAWIGGQRIEASVEVQPLPFSVMLVQPHVRGSDTPWQPWAVLDQLTRRSLKQDGPVQLIVWPETSLSTSFHPQSITKEISQKTSSENEKSQAKPLSDSLQLSLRQFQQRCQSAYGTACLVGVPLVKQVTVERYGLEVREQRIINAACLVTGTGEIGIHEKLVLVPIREGLPDFLETPWVRAKLLPYYQLQAPMARGDHFRCLAFQTNDGQTIRIAASVCFESHLPWLPQFSQTNGVDAVVHLLYDGDFSDHPAWTQRQLIACRYRAIESRTWGLVCSTWSGSAIINPAGQVIQQLPAEPQVLRSEQAGAVEE